MKILVIRNGGIGDTLLLVPFLQAIRAKFAPSELWAMGRHDVLAILEREEIIDRAIPFEQDGIWRLYGEGEEFGAQITNLFSSFDRIFSMVGDKDGSFERNLKKISNVEILSCSPLPPKNRIGHASKYYIESFGLEHCAIPAQVRPFEIREEDVESAHHFSRDHGIDFKKDKVIALHPGSGSTHKNWPIENFYETMRLLTEKGHKVLCIFGPAEEEGGVALQGKIEGMIPVHLPLGPLSSLLKFCSSYIGNDSGISHLAGLAGIPALVIFGPTAPDLWVPLGPNVRPFSRRLGCSPCPPGEWRKCKGRDCLRSICVEEVVSCQ